MTAPCPIFTRAAFERCVCGRLTPDADPDTLALLAALKGGLLLTQIQRDTKPLEAELDSILELIARLGARS